VVILTAAGAHEHGSAAGIARDDLEAEDPTVELGGNPRITNNEHRVVQPSDRDHRSAPFTTR
jgi:hypothetical protein